jgi:hypothetical protein
VLLFYADPGVLDAPEPAPPPVLAAAVDADNDRFARSQARFAAPTWDFVGEFGSADARLRFFLAVVARSALGREARECAQKIVAGAKPPALAETLLRAADGVAEICRSCTVSEIIEALVIVVRAAAGGGVSFAPIGDAVVGRLRDASWRQAANGAAVLRTVLERQKIAEDVRGRWAVTIGECIVGFYKREVKAGARENVDFSALFALLEVLAVRIEIDVAPAEIRRSKAQADAYEKWKTAVG